MNYTLYVPAQNCCDINVCHTNCMMIGHLTLIGWMFILLFVIMVSMILIYGSSLKGEKDGN